MHIPLITYFVLIEANGLLKCSSVLLLQWNFNIFFNCKFPYMLFLAGDFCTFLLCGISLWVVPQCQAPASPGMRSRGSQGLNWEQGEPLLSDLLCNGRDTTRTTGEQCLYLWRKSGASLVHQFLNHHSHSTGNKYCTLFFLLQIESKVFPPAFLQIWTGEGCFSSLFFCCKCLLQRSISSDLTDYFQSSVLSIPLALVSFLLCRETFNFVHSAKHPPKHTRE